MSANGVSATTRKSVAGFCDEVGVLTCGRFAAVSCDQAATAAAAAAAKCMREIFHKKQQHEQHL
jgi:hypothetical protein